VDADIHYLHMRIEALDGLFRSFLVMASMDSERNAGNDYSHFLQGGCQTILVALDGPALLAEAEAITAESAANHTARRMRDLRQKADKPFLVPVPPE
jgi:hypothetical protein